MSVIGKDDREYYGQVMGLVGKDSFVMVTYPGYTLTKSTRNGLHLNKGTWTKLKVKEDDYFHLISEQTLNSTKLLNQKHV